MAATVAAVMACAPIANAQMRSAAMAVDEFRDVATVVSFDRRSREAILYSRTGNTLEMRVPPAAPILDHMNAGDIVSLHYLELQSVELNHGGVASRSEEHSFEVAPPGNAAGITFVNTVRATLFVHNVDSASGMLVVQDASNNILAVRMTDEVKTLDRIAAGDTITFVFIEAAVLQVLPPSKSDKR